MQNCYGHELIGSWMNKDMLNVLDRTNIRIPKHVDSFLCSLYSHWEVTFAFPVLSLGSLQLVVTVDLYVFFEICFELSIGPEI